MRFIAYFTLIKYEIISIAWTMKLPVEPATINLSAPILYSGIAFKGARYVEQ